MFELNQSGIETRCRAHPSPSPDSWVWIEPKWNWDSENVPSLFIWSLLKSLNWTKVELRLHITLCPFHIHTFYRLNWTKVELRLNFTPFLIASFSLSLNWTKVELRLNFFYYFLGYIFWGLNWTKVELRPQYLHIFRMSQVRSLNWTKVELRHNWGDVPPIFSTKFELNQSGIETLLYLLLPRAWLWLSFELNQSGIETICLDNCIWYKSPYVWIEPKWNWDFCVAILLLLSFLFELNQSGIETLVWDPNGKLDLGSVWIEPKWNWYLIILFEPPINYYRLNWTKVELRYTPLF